MEGVIQKFESERNLIEEENQAVKIELERLKEKYQEVRKEKKQLSD